MYPEYLQTICDSCGEFIKTSIEFLVRIDDGVSYEGLICPRCGNVLLLDNVVLQIAKGKTKRKVKLPHRPKAPKKKKWKIIQKGKVKPNES